MLRVTVVVVVAVFIAVVVAVGRYPTIATTSAASRRGVRKEEIQ